MHVGAESTCTSTQQETHNLLLHEQVEGLFAEAEVAQQDELVRQAAHARVQLRAERRALCRNNNSNTSC